MSSLRVKYWIKDSLIVQNLSKRLDNLSNDFDYISLDINTSDIEGDAYIEILISKNNNQKIQDNELTNKNNPIVNIHKQIIEKINKEARNNKSLISDEISEKLAIMSYPKVHKLENTLREFLTRYFRRLFGSDWNSEEHRGLYKSLISGGKPDVHISKNIFYQLNFDHLKDILCTKFPLKPCFEIKDLLKNNNSISSKEITPFLEKNHIDQYFGSIRNYFSDFCYDWSNIYSIRNKIAHNKQYTIDDYIELSDLYKKWIEIITNSLDKISQIEITLKEREQLRLSANISEKEIKQIINKNKPSLKDKYYSSKYFYISLNIEEALIKIISTINVNKSQQSKYKSEKLKKHMIPNCPNDDNGKNGKIWFYSYISIIVTALDSYLENIRSNISNNESYYDNKKKKDSSTVSPYDELYDLREDIINICKELTKSQRRFHKVQSCMMIAKYEDYLEKNKNKWRSSICYLYKAIKNGDDVIKSDCSYQISQYYKQNGDISKTVIWLRKCTKYKNIKACIELAHLYKSQKEFYKAAKFYKEGNDLFNHHLQLAKIYDNKYTSNLFSDTNSSEFQSAEENYHHAINNTIYTNNIIEAKYSLAELYNSTDESKFKDKAFALYSELAKEYQYPDAMYDLGLSYKNGDGIEENPQKAIKWLTKSMNKGIAEAKDMLIEVYGEIANSYKVTYESTKDPYMKLKAIVSYHQASNIISDSYKDELTSLLK